MEIVRGAAGTTAPGASIAATIVTTAKLPWHSDSWRAALTRGNHPGVDGPGAGSFPPPTGRGPTTAGGPRSPGEITREPMAPAPDPFPPRPALTSAISSSCFHGR